MKKLLSVCMIFMILALAGCREAVAGLSGIDPERDAADFNKEIAEESAVEAMAAADEREKRVHITFADNSFLSVKYYRSDSFSPDSLISADEVCHMLPGERVYARVTTANAAGNYAFSEFRIFGINENGEREELAVSAQDNGLIWTVPENAAFREISVVPEGEYDKRVISLSACYLSDDGETHNLPADSGKWLINGAEYSADKRSAEISGVADCSVTFSYDSDTYFFVNSSSDRIGNGENGGISFKKLTAAEIPDDISYYIELKKYLTASVPADEDRNVRVISENGSEEISLNKGQYWEKGGLRYGDELTVRTNKPWPSLSSSKLLKIKERRETAGQTEYTLQVVEGGGDFVFDPAEYSYAHGKVQFLLDGTSTVIDKKRYLAVGREILCRAAEAENGYWLPEKTVMIDEDFDKTRDELRAVRFYPDKNVTVELPRPKYGGSIAYFADGRDITTDLVSLRCGTVIEIRPKAWDGWSVGGLSAEQARYTVTETDSQTANINGTDMTSLFTEQLSHKPELTVNFDKTAKELSFNIKTDGSSREKLGFESEKSVKFGRIGSRTGVSVKADGAVPSGKALKIYVRKITAENTFEAEVYYLTNLLDTAEVSVYDYSRTSLPVYSSVEISVSVAEASLFKPEKLNNAVVRPYFNDVLDKVKLTSGIIADNDREIVLEIIPDSGYYVGGPDVNNGVYRKTMKYGDYLKNIDKILSSHPVKRYFKVTLPNRDEICRFDFMYDGDYVGGTVNVREGSKLTLTYTVINDGYKSKQAKVDIPVKAEMDGQTLDVSGYVKVERK